MRTCIQLITRKYFLVLLIFVFAISGCSQRGNFLTRWIGDASPEPSVKNNNSGQPNHHQYYTIKKGDTLYAIGFRTGLGYKNIAEWNEISHPYKVGVGQEICLFDPRDKIQPRQKLPSPSVEIQIINKMRIKEPRIKKSQENQVNNLSASSLELSSFISAVLKANPKLEVAEAAWQASAARIQQQSALDDPVFAYGFAPGTIANRQMRFGQTIELTQKIPWPGKLPLKEKAASSLAKAGQENIISVRLNLVALAKQLYSDWYYIDQAIRVTADNLTLLTQFKEIANMRYQLGSSRKQDVLQADLEYSVLIHKQYKFNRKKSEISGQINTLLSRPADTVLPPAKKLPDPVKIASLLVLQEMALDNYPELKALNARLKALEFDQQRTRLDAFPDFKLKAGYNSLLRHSDKHFSVGVAVNLPLDQSKRQAANDEAAARLKKAHWQKTDLINNLAETIQVHLARVEEFEHSLLVCKKRLLPLAEQTMRAVRQDYQAGVGDFMRLIEAEKTLHDYRLKEAQSLTNYHRSIALLEQAVGVSRLTATGD